MNDTRTLEQLQAQLLRKEQELALANECLARFTYGISHEMNSPVRTLNKLLMMFKEDYDGQIDEDGVELLNMMMTSSRRTQELVSGLLDFAKHSQAIEETVSVDAHQIALQVVQQLETEMDLGDAVINVGDMPDVHATPDAIRTLFHHLIDNALTFTATPDTPPEISIFGQVTGDAVEYVVEDRGIGVKPEEADNIFTVFKRLHARSAYEGAGLGLPVCRLIVNALNGNIWVTPGQPNGAAFHVLIPTISRARP